MADVGRETIFQGDQSLERIAAGWRVLGNFSELDQNDKPNVFAGLVTAMAYDIIGDSYTPEDLGEMLDSIDEARAVLEQSTQAKKWRIEEAGRRSAPSPEEY